MATVIIFPGLSSPFHERYIPVYDLLRQGAQTRNISIEILTYPGQSGFQNGKDVTINPRSIVNYCRDYLNDFEQKGESYHVIGLSFGSCVSLRVCSELANDSNCQSITIWGMVPHWKNWELFWDSSTVGIGLGSKVDTELYYKELIPIEYLVNKVDIPLAMGVGAMDKFSDVNFVNYLKHIYQKDNLRYCECINDCNHNVSANDIGHDEYSSFIFRLAEEL